MDRSGEEAGLCGIDQEKRIMTMAFVLHGMVFGSLGMAPDFGRGAFDNFRIQFSIVGLCSVVAP